MSKEAEKFIEKYTTKDQNDWLVEKKDIIARFMESYHTEQLRIGDVSQQRELLKAYAELIQINYTTHFFDDAVEESIEEFLSL